MQAYTRADRGPPEYPGGFGRCQTVPGDEPQELLVTLIELQEREAQLVVERRVWNLISDRFGCPEERYALLGRIAATLVCEHPASDTEKPRKFPTRDGLEPFPGNQEGLGDSVVSNRRRRATPRV